MYFENTALLRKIRLVTPAVLIVSLLFSQPTFAQSRLTTVYVAHGAATLTDIPYYVAREKGFYRDDGLEVVSLFVQGGALAAQVLVAGSVDFSLALGSGTRGALAGAPIKGIFVFNDKPYFFLYGRPDLGVREPEDLKGKKIAVTGVGSSTDFAARAMVQHFGMNPDKDVSILATGGGGNVWSAIQTGAVQAAILWPPYDLAAQKFGMRRILYLGEILSLPGGGVVAADQLLRDNPEKVKKFLRATWRGLRFFLDEKNRADNVAMVAKTFQLDENTASATYGFMRTIVTKDGAISQKTIENDLDIALGRIRDPKIQSLSRQQQVNRMYDFSMLQEVLGEEKTKR